MNQIYHNITLLPATQHTLACASLK